MGSKVRTTKRTSAELEVKGVMEKDMDLVGGVLVVVWRQ